jgi:DNA-binding SARP family transcriptional activator
MAAIAELMATAEDDTGVELADPSFGHIEVSVERPAPARRNGAVTARLAALDDDLPDLGEAPVLVRVLGSVEVEGAWDFKRAKSRELVVYLAMHPNGVGEAELDEALWGSRSGRVVLSSTRDSTVSVARTSLGGFARLLPAQGQGREKRYQLGPEVGSDWGQFCLLHRFGREHRSTDALRQALDLVRGRPFEAVISGRTYGWVHTEGHGRHIEAEVADAADLAAGLYLETGDALSARWAARRGLLAEPYTERLWVRLMEAADELGESREIERIMDEMDVVLELDGDFTSLHPNTLAAYDRLSRRRRFPAGT